MQNQWTLPWIYTSNLSVQPYQTYYYFFPIEAGLQNYQEPSINPCFSPLQANLEPSPPEPLDQQPTSSISRTHMKKEEPFVKQQNADYKAEFSLDHSVHIEEEPISKYAKKNVESNIVNQVFSFLCMRSKSGRLIDSILNSNEAQIRKYYELLRAVKKLNKKYINRIYLFNLLQLDRSNPIYKVISRTEYESVLPKEILKKCLRILSIHYLEEVCINTIFTSGKLERITKREHLKRRREVLGFIYEQHGCTHRANKY